MPTMVSADHLNLAESMRQKEIQVCIKGGWTEQLRKECTRILNGAAQLRAS